MKSSLGNSTCCSSAARAGLRLGGRTDLKPSARTWPISAREVRADIAALNSRIDSLDARFTYRIDALYQALFSHKYPAA